MKRVVGKKTSALPVRLEDSQREAIQGISDAIGLTPSTIIRLLLDQFIRRYHEAGGKVVLPIEVDVDVEDKKARKKEKRIGLLGN